MQKIQLNQKSQSGRSMVEMLGVLAIIGVLSIGGITGYRYAMNKHTENKMLKMVDEFYLFALTEINRKDSLFYEEDITAADLGWAFCDFIGKGYCRYPVADREHKFFLNPQNGNDANTGVKWHINVAKHLNLNPSGTIVVSLAFTWMPMELCHDMVNLINNQYKNELLGYAGAHGIVKPDEALTKFCDRDIEELRKKGFNVMTLEVDFKALEL